MNLLNKYIFREWGKAFLLTLLAIVSLFLLAEMSDDLIDLINWGVSTPDIIKYYFIMIPGLFPIILPISILISLLFILGNLHRNGEIVAMRASGLSIFQITKMLWISGFFLTILMLYMNSYLIPWSVEESRQMATEMKFKKEAEEKTAEQVGIIRALAYDNPNNNHLWFINRYSEYTKHAYGITIYNRNDKGNEISRILAKEGYFNDNSGYWTLLSGKKILFAPETSDPLRSITFDEQNFPDLTDDPKLIAALSKKPKHLSFNQLKEILNATNYEENASIAKYAVMYHLALASPLSCIIVVGLAIPFATSGVRKNPIVGVSKAIGLFFLYYIAISIFDILGSQLIISPILAAWVPNILVIAFSIYLFIRNK